MEEQKMDRNLLALWQAVPSGKVKKEQITEILDLSAKQASRHLQKWTAEGWFTYTAGRGRGNASELQWLKNVEKLYEEQLMEIIEQEAVETSSKYLMFDWSIDAKLRLIERFRAKFGYSQDNGEIDKLIIPRRYRLMTMNPLETADVHSANFVATVFNRLVSVDSKGNVSPEIAHSWDAAPTKLRLYLKKGVKFHDGSLLTAEDVAKCLNRIRSHQNFKKLWEPVKTISVPAPLVVDFDFPGGCSYCLQMLGMITSSIFKESSGQFYGTGSFCLDNSNKLKTVLVAFKDYFGERPLLDAIEFVQVPEDFDFVYRTSQHKNQDETFIVESDSGVGVVIMNTFRDSAIKRKDVRDFLHSIILKHRHSVSEADSRILPNSEGMLIGHNQQYNLPPVERPHFEEPIVIKTTSYLENITEWLKKVFEQEGVPVEIYSIPFQEYLLDNGRDQQADLYIQGEVFEMNQDFSFYYFLINGLSPFTKIFDSDPKLSRFLPEYADTPFEEWTTLNLKIEKALVESSVLVPLYYAKRQTPFASELMNINLSHFGYVDFSKLWVRPNIER
jgi:SgrR family transcriptional regulator